MSKLIRVIKEDKQFQYDSNDTAITKWDEEKYCFIVLPEYDADGIEVVFDPKVREGFTNYEHEIRYRRGSTNPNRDIQTTH